MLQLSLICSAFHIWMLLTQRVQTIWQGQYECLQQVSGNVDWMHFLHTQQQTDIKVLRLSLEGFWGRRQKTINSSFPVLIRWRNTCLGAITGRAQIIMAKCKAKTVIRLVEFSFSFTPKYCCLTEFYSLI